MKIYVGNLPWEATEADLRTFFDGFTVQRVTLITDRETGKPRGFAFVELKDADADKVISQLDGQELGGREIRVSEAHGSSKGGRNGRGNKRDDYGWRK
jgi:RNA recognition motif-containing protein